jgi:DNA-binding transcriptional LysR family regulator
LVAVAKRESFTYGAFDLNLTQSTVSGHIAALEEKLGLDLFERSGKKVTLTKAGILALGKAKQILKQAEELENLALSGRLPQAGTISIGASKIIGAFILPAQVVEFKKSSPSVQIELNVTDAKDIIYRTGQGLFDIGIIAECETLPANLGHSKIGEDRIVAITSPGSVLARKRVLRRRDLCSLPFILPGRDSATAFGIHKALDALGIRLTGSLEISSPGALKRAVIEGGGAALISQAAVARELRCGEVAELELEGISLKRDIWMIWKQDKRMSKTCELYIRALRKYFAADAPCGASD